MLNTASASRVQKLDGRLEVPRGWIKKLGWSEGDRIDAVQDGNAVVLKPYADVTAGEEVVYQFTVDRWNRIRVTNRALSKAGINTGGAHVVTLQNGSVKVE
jgi:bifunctional DNA-binding transcriptional regulator/antitoxin component of YhaV-PrlF toxin-antitoxin module